LKKAVNAVIVQGEKFLVINGRFLAELLKKERVTSKRYSAKLRKRLDWILKKL
jgi:hypothetical protein